MQIVQSLTFDQDIRANEARDDTANASSRARIVAIEREVRVAKQEVDSLRTQEEDFGDDVLDLDDEEEAALNRLHRERVRVE
jgi:hypothetical protein